MSLQRLRRNLTRARPCAMAAIFLSGLLFAGCGGGGGKKSAGTPPEKATINNPDGDSTDSSYLIQSVTGFPTGLSNLSTFTINIKKRNGNSTLQWKIANYSKTECARERGWSQTTADSVLTINAPNMPDGEIVACIRAFTEDGLDDSNYLIFRWQSDRTVPESASSAAFTTPVPPSTQGVTRDVGLRWVICQDKDGPNGEDPSGLKMHRVQVGTTEGGKDVLTRELGVLDYETSITLPRDGKFYFSIACPDLAGNEVVTNFAYPIDVDTTPPPAPASVSWNRTSPTNQATGIVLSWSPVSDDTEVTYLYRLDNRPDSTLTFLPVATNSVTLDLSSNSYGGVCPPPASRTKAERCQIYASVKAINAAGQASSTHIDATPLVVDTTAPVFNFTGMPNNDQETLEMGLSTAELDFAAYQYKILKGDIVIAECQTMGTWSDWTSPDVLIKLNIAGPAYQTTMAFCARGKDTAGNETPLTLPLFHKWNNTPYPAGSAAKDDFNLMFAWSAAGSIKSLKTSPNPSPSPAPPFVWASVPETLLAGSAVTSYGLPDITLRSTTPYVTATKTSSTNHSITGLSYGGSEAAEEITSTTSAGTAISVTYANPLTWVFYGAGGVLSSIFHNTTWSAVTTVATAATGNFSRVKSVTAPNGTIYSAWEESTSNGTMQVVKVRKIPTSGSPTDYELAPGSEGILNWCDSQAGDGMAYLLDIAVNPDNQLNLLIACFSNTDGNQKIRLQRGPFDSKPPSGWPSAEILRTTARTPIAKGTLTFSVDGNGSIGELVAFTHPAESSAVRVCYNPPNTSANESCPSDLISGTGSTFALASYLSSGGVARILFASELSGFVRIGIAGGIAINSAYITQWLHAESTNVNKNNFSLAPRLLLVP